ncbi:MAG: hypothetical protein ACOX8Q_09195 [Christensenellales bacterium]
MVLDICIVGIVVSIVGMVKEVKGAVITFVLWVLLALGLIIGLSSLRGSVYSFILTQIIFILEMIWIIKINKTMGEV